MFRLPSSNLRARAPEGRGAKVVFLLILLEPPAAGRPAVPRLTPAAASSLPLRAKRSCEVPSAAAIEAAAESSAEDGAAPSPPRPMTPGRVQRYASELQSSRALQTVGSSSPLPAYLQQQWLRGDVPGVNTERQLTPRQV